ncbi:MAG: hypothetical protein GY729_16350 [Desulfobacteraceae bacterium]|nr:hypothetical protein [Desulfobacteraceae bacterium]
MEKIIKIDSLDTAKFACPECKKTKVMQLSEYNLKNNRTKVKCNCRCGHSFKIVLEKKLNISHETELIGTFVSSGQIKCSGKMIIKKLNSSGILFKTNLEQRIIPGLRIMVEFVLDDPKQSIVKKEVVVKAKQGKYFSANFVSSDHYDNLGPYLFFNKLYI